MSIRRIGTGTDGAGRSCVVSNGMASHVPGFAEPWQSAGGDPLAGVASVGGPPVKLAVVMVRLGECS